MKTIVVLGMHRSCTSLLAKGLLHSRDCHIGEKLLLRGKGNPKGHFENVDFVSMNDSILKFAGGSWNNPPPEYEILKVGQALSDQIEKLIRLSERRIWGWKDPRTTLTIRCYMPYLTNPVFMACFRDPKEVAKSLTKRDGSDFEKNIELAKEYNQRLLKFLAEYADI